MDTDALHSALVSLTVLPEQIHSAREKVATANAGVSSAFEEFLTMTERDLRIAKATLARELGFPICTCCWPPELLALDTDGGTYCPGTAKPTAVSVTRHKRIPKAAVQNKKPKGPRVDAYSRAQKDKLLRLRDVFVDSINSVAKGNLRARAHGKEATSFVGDLADTGSDAAEHDLALSLLSQEHDALNEIDQALKRIACGVYGVCEMSGQPIHRERLEAIPFARYTVECQAQVERQRKFSHARRPAPSLADALESDTEDSENTAHLGGRRSTLSESFARFESPEAALHLSAGVR